MNTKTKIILILNIFVIIASATLIVWQLIKGDDLRILSKAIVLFVTYFLAVVRFLQKLKDETPNYKILEHTYKDEIRDAFSTNPRAYKKLMQCIYAIHTKNPDYAISKLEKLLNSCSNNHDTAAVFMFISVCFYQKEDYAKTIEYCEKVVELDQTYSSAWNSIGYCYRKLGQHHLVAEAYDKALFYNPENTSALVNMAAYQIDIGNYEKALSYTQKSIRIDNTFENAFSMTAVIYAFMGDEENARTYAKIYASKNGGFNPIKFKWITGEVDKYLEYSKHNYS